MPSTASSPSADCWNAFRLRRDAVYLQTDSGMLFRGPRSTFALKGRTVYDAFQRLLPHLDGTGRIGAGWREAPEASRAPLTRLLVQLRDGGIIERFDADDARLADPDIARRFAPQIDFIAHVDARPTARFLAFRDSTVLLRGGGVALRSAGLALLRNGLRTLRVACAPEEDLSTLGELADRLRGQGLESRVERCDDAVDLPFAMTLYCAENPDLSVLQRLNRNAVEHGRPFLAAHGHHGNTLIGPRVVPGAAGCWSCAMLRWSDQAPGHAASDTWRGIALGRHAAERPAVAELPAQILGNNAALEVFKHFALPQALESTGRVLVQDAASLISGLKAVLPHPECPACRTPKPQRQGTGRLDDAGLLAAWTPYIDPVFGVFRGFDDDRLEQLPLRITQLSLSPAAASRHGVPEAAVTAWSLRDSDGARATALRHAIALAAAADPPRHLRRASVACAEAADAPRVPAAALWGWQGNGGERAASHRHLKVHGGDGAPAWLPAGAVHPQLDTNACFDPHGAGVGCGATEDEAIDAALLSLAAHRAIAGLADGSLVPRALAWRGGGGNKDVEYLATAAAQFGLSDASIGLLTPGPGLFAAVECGREPVLARTDSLAVGTGFSAAAAVADLLAAIVARAQLQRHGLALTTLRPPGRYAGLEIGIACDGGADLPLDAGDAAEPASSCAARRASPWWWLDITPPDVAWTGTLRVVKVVSGRTAAQCASAEPVATLPNAALQRPRTAGP